MMTSMWHNCTWLCATSFPSEFFDPKRTTGMLKSLLQKINRTYRKKWLMQKTQNKKHIIRTVVWSKYLLWQQNVSVANCRKLSLWMNSIFLKIEHEVIKRKKVSTETCHLAAKILQGHLVVKCVVPVVKCFCLKPAVQANSLMALMTYKMVWP